MKTVTIRRNKTFVGCAAKLKVYLEDPNGTDLEIDNHPLRKLGELKNGEEKSFEIPESDLDRRLYIAVDKMSREICNDFYVIPAGEGDLSLSGKCHFNPAIGNAFRFDGNTGAEVTENRKSAKRKGLMILLIAVLVGAAVGAVFGTVRGINRAKTQPKEFVTGEMTVTLTGDFKKAAYEGEQVCYESGNTLVMILREDFEIGSDVSRLSLDEYGRIVIETNKSKFIAEPLQHEDGLTYTDYCSRSTDGKIYDYFTVFYKSRNAFWTVQFITTKDNADKLRPQFIDYAKSVRFSD